MGSPGRRCWWERETAALWAAAWQVLRPATSSHAAQRLRSRDVPGRHGAHAYTEACVRTFTTMAQMSTW